MIKVKVKFKNEFYKLKKAYETGVYKKDKIIIKIGKNNYYIGDAIHYTKWSDSGKINNYIKYDINEEKIKEILFSQTNKVIKDLDDIIYYISRGINYYKRGTKNFEGIKIEKA